MSTYNTLADRIRSEAAQASRPGQMQRLEAMAEEVEELRRSAKTPGHVIEQERATAERYREAFLKANEACTVREIKLAQVEALAEQLANPDVDLIGSIERAHRRIVARELRAALNDTDADA